MTHFFYGRAGVVSYSHLNILLGRIAFGIFTVKKDEVQRFGKVPLYLVITPEKTAVYGTKRKEHFNLMSMNTFLKSVQPEMNDLFLCSLVLVNMFAVLHFLQVFICPLYHSNSASLSHNYERKYSIFEYQTFMLTILVMLGPT